MKSSAEKQLAENKMDYLAAISRAALSAIPIAGGLLGELITTIIPNQRIDRIADFSVKLEERIDALEWSNANDIMQDADFTDLLEDAVIAAARAVTEERRSYLASLVANSLTSEDISYVESKHLLRILNELNDIEILWLRYYFGLSIGGDKEFQTKHENVLVSADKSMPPSDRTRDKKALQDSYREHLLQLNLLEEKIRTFKIDDRTKVANVDSIGKPERKSIGITRLGKMLLASIDLIPE
ncbi:MAG: hypothetical protein FWG78_00135 [Coriobacteriia bacterium]|nr:hypothetical protein [Coriobacteriia bacterium]